MRIPNKRPGNKHRVRAIFGKRVVPSEIPAGIVGMGLMGTSIAACLLIAGHPVMAVEENDSKRRSARVRLPVLLKEARAEGLFNEPISTVIRRFRIGKNYSILAPCEIVVESIIENLAAKRRVISKVERSIGAGAIIGSNTSAIPVSQLQAGTRHPARIMGIHWGEPAHVLRFMEIICGQLTAPALAERAVALARAWGKEPSLLRKDIRGFITNRCMYALMREAFNLVESGYASIEAVDRSLRNDLGYWITFAGPFRFMDLTGISAYAAVMKDMLPDLSCSKRVPPLIQKLVEQGARGVSNARGFYPYTKLQAKRWEKLFLKFSYEIRALAQKYPGDAGDHEQ